MNHRFTLPITLFAITSLVSAPHPVHADLAPSPDQRPVDYVLSLENQNAFPDCLVIVPSCFPRQVDADTVAVVLEGEIGCDGLGGVFGVLRADYDAARPTWQTLYDPLSKFEHAPGVMKSDAVVQALHVVPKDLSVKLTHDVLRIDQCVAGKFSASFAKTIYTLLDGSTVEQSWNSRMRPNPSLAVPRVSGHGCGGCTLLESGIPSATALTIALAGLLLSRLVHWARVRRNR